MKKKMVQLLIGATMTSAVIGMQMPAVMAEEGDAESVISVVENAEETLGGTATETETVAESNEAPMVTVQAESQSESESETETETDDFIEGSALLSDYDYEPGKIDEKGWTSEFLDMMFTPGKDFEMDVKDHEQLAEYYHRHGDDKLVANSEMVAKDKDGGYVQLAVEVNPNAEDAEDILGRFSDLEKLELVSKAKDTEIAGKTFKTCTGIFEKEKYMVGVCTDQDNVVIAIKVKYKDTDGRKALLACFDTVEKADEETEMETEAETAVETAADTVTLELPSAFEDAQTSFESESESITNTD